jgi:hypothetical protein
VVALLLAWWVGAYVLFTLYVMVLIAVMVRR